MISANCISRPYILDFIDAIEDDKLDSLPAAGKVVSAGWLRLDVQGVIVLLNISNIFTPAVYHRGDFILMLSLPTAHHPVQILQPANSSQQGGGAAVYHPEKTTGIPAEKDKQIKRWQILVPRFRATRIHNCWSSPGSERQRPVESATNQGGTQGSHHHGSHQVPKLMMAVRSDGNQP
jgi:hypothetical protein